MMERFELRIERNPRSPGGREAIAQEDGQGLPEGFRQAGLWLGALS